jgi:hypothetical protein
MADRTDSCTNFAIFEPNAHDVKTMRATTTFYNFIQKLYCLLYLDRERNVFLNIVINYFPT